MSGNQQVNFIGGEGPGDGLACFVESFTDGLDPYIAIVGTKAPFSIIDTDRGKTLLIAGGVSPTCTIRRTLSGDRARSTRMFVQIKNSLIDDAAFITLGNASPQVGYIAYAPRREIALGGPRFHVTHSNGVTSANSFIGAGALIINRWYEILTTLSSTQCVTTVTDTVTGLVHGSFTHAADYSNIPINAIFWARDDNANCNPTWIADVEVCGLISGANRADDLSGFRLNLSRGTIAGAQSGNVPNFTLRGMRLSLNDLSNLLSTSTDKLTGGRLQLRMGSLHVQTYEEPARPYFGIVISGTKGGEEQFGNLAINTDGSCVTSWDSVVRGEWATPNQVNLGNYFDIRIESLQGSGSFTNNVFQPFSSAVLLSWGSFGANFRITIRPGPAHVNYGVSGLESYGEVDVRLSNPGS